LMKLKIFNNLTKYYEKRKFNQTKGCKMKAKFKSLNGYFEDSSYIEFDIENGDNAESIGDVVWFAKDGKTVQISENISKKVFVEMIQLFEHSSRMAVRGALRRMNVVVW